MAVDTPSYFAQVIQDHLDLKRQNAELEPEMPLERYKHEDPFHNHPLFKTEEQARIEDTLDGEPAVDTQTDRVVDWVGEDTVEYAFPGAENSEGLWGRSREFDWGD
jgi:hypothetical protein